MITITSYTDKNGTTRCAFDSYVKSDARKRDKEKVESLGQWIENFESYYMSNSGSLYFKQGDTFQEIEPKIKNDNQLLYDLKVFDDDFTLTDHILLLAETRFDEKTNYPTCRWSVGKGDLL